MRMTSVLAALILLAGCGSGSGTAPAASDDGSGMPAAATAGTGGSGPETSGLADIVLSKINAVTNDDIVAYTLRTLSEDKMTTTAIGPFH